MKEKNVTLADIARELGVSKNAISLALRGKEGVSRELRERVAAKAQEMNYQGLRKPDECILALIPQRFTRTESGFYHRLCFDMEASAAASGCRLIISSVSAEEEAACLKPALLGSISFTGVMTVGNLSRAYCRMIRSLGLRYIMVDQYYDDIPVDSVTTANTSGAYLLTSHLIEQGHRSIQFIGTSLRTSSLEDRWIGYKRAMRDHDLPILSNPLTQQKGIVSENFDLICNTLNALPALPTAFVCGHDITARDVIRALAQRNLSCPQHFSVVGFDNIQSLDIQALNLTTYATPSTAIAQAAIDLLKQDTSGSPRRIQLYGEMISRESVGAAEHSR